MPEFAACTASIVNARMAFDMRCLSCGLASWSPGELHAQVRLGSLGWVGLAQFQLFRQCTTIGWFICVLRLGTEINFLGFIRF